MAEVTTFIANAPCWAGLRSPDPAASTTFYASLFRWEATVAPNGYVVYSLDGKDVAGAAPLLSDSQPPEWCMYIGVEDADGVVAASIEAGGTIVVEPFDAAGYGRVGVVADPSGAECWIWEPLGFAGAKVVGEPNTVGWRELNTNDLEAAAAFYRAVFGWNPVTVRIGRPQYSVWNLGGESIGGVLATDAGSESMFEAQWIVFFVVEDVDAVVAKVRRLGGAEAPRSAASPITSALLRDLHGACFGLVEAGAIER